MIILAAATLISSLTIPVKPVVAMPSWRDGAVLHMARNDDVPSGKRPTRFREVVQGVQYDGDYSPDSARDPEPAASPTTPVRYLPWWKRQIPVRVKPAPRYVDPVQPQNQNGQQPDQNQQQVGQTGQGYAPAPTQTYAPAPVDPDIVTSGGASTVGSGSATGSTAVATYGELPAPSTTVSAPAGSTIIQVGQPRG